MKMFRTSNMDVISQCQSYFDFKLPSTLWSNRVKTFDVKYATCEGTFWITMSNSGYCWCYYYYACVFIYLFFFSCC